ncbi:hypothetical protein BGW41_001910 [Actinomortierella wolfii]|nr:hypothetical protein BGW41_001910 [Actinomortierella wolfii]
MFSPKRKALQEESKLRPDSSSPASADNLLSTQTVSRPLLQQLRLTVASDAIYLSEHTLGGTEQAVPTKSLDPAPPPRVLRIAYADSSVDNSDGENKVVKQRVELLNEDIQPEALHDARDYVVYGCIGLLDLYTGLNLIVVSAITDLGRIEDKPVYMIKKVAIVPLNRDGACEILDKQGLGYDQFLDVSRTPSSLGEDPTAPLAAAASVSSSSLTGVAIQEVHGPDSTLAPTTPTPKVKFALISDSKKRTSEEQQPQATSQSASTLKPALSITTSNGDNFEKADDGDVLSSTVSPLQSPRSPKSGFLSKIKMSFSNQELKGQDNVSNGHHSIPSSVSSTSLPRTSTSDDNLVAPSSPRQQTLQQQPTPTPEPMKKRMSFDGFRRGRFALGGESSQIPAKDKAGSKSSVEPLATASNSSDTSVDQKSHSSSTAVTTNDKNGNLSVPLPASEEPPVPSSLTSTPSATPIKSSTPRLDAAEAFISNAARQLGSWSEEVVSGLLPTESKTEAEEEAEQELEKNQALDRKVIREVSSFFSSGFYFSYEFNLLSSMQQRSRLPKGSNMALWKQVDHRFWWNEHLQKALLDINAEEFILPIMQGFVEIEKCEIEEQAFEFIVISRRSRERSGLRYQRRGIDVDGHAANFVETEQLLRIVRDDSDHQVSFVQIRGSIPLFWSQSPYHLKPLPILERSIEENEAGFKRHFDDLLERYGRQILVNLVEQHGREMIAGSAYTRYVSKLNDPQIKLIQKLETAIQELGYCWQTSNLDAVMTASAQQQFHILHTQKGVIRTNCMDCLDRTNVVQSALARHVLNQQLLKLGISSFPEHGLSVYEHFESIFNHVWANNGDAISRAYAGTSALKGDFTRTGKRNWQGMVNDATNSIARMYQNTFKDSFRQAAIDYMLGLTDVSVFKNLQTTAFGTAVVPAPILPSTSTTSLSLPQSQPHTSPKTEPLEPISQEAVTSDSNISILPESDGTLLIDQPPVDISASTVSNNQQQQQHQHQIWAKIREAAIETSAEIVISSGEDNWRGWTLLCCSNEVSSALPSASSGQASTDASQKNDRRQRGARGESKDSSSSSTTLSDVFYDEKVVLLTDRALYICTYDYEMEKVLEFWRLALEKLVAIDKGTFIISTATPRDVDVVENYGFAIIYRTNVQGETLRVNTGSVRNRQAMTRGTVGAPKLEPLAEEEGRGIGQTQELNQVESPKASSDHPQDAATNRTDSNQNSGETCLQSVRFKVVQHPESRYLPFVQSSSLSSPAPMTAIAAAAGCARDSVTGGSGGGQAKKTIRPTAQDCVELIIKDIIQARCELIRANSPPPCTPSTNNESLPATVAAVESDHVAQQNHGRTPSEEYNFGASKGALGLTPVDLTIRERVLQDEAAAAILEAYSMKQSLKTSQKSKKSHQESSLTMAPTVNDHKDKERRGGRGGGSKILAFLTSSGSKRSSTSSHATSKQTGETLQNAEKTNSSKDGKPAAGGKTPLGFSPFKSSKKETSSMINLLSSSSLGKQSSSSSTNQEQPQSNTDTPSTSLSPSLSSKGWFGKKKNKQQGTNDGK